MTERGDGDDRDASRSGARRNPFGDEPPAPSEPFDPSTQEFPAVRTGEAEQIERRHEAVSMDTSTFMAIPAPTPTTPFVPPDFDVRQGRLGRSTAFFSIATAFSRVAGLVREIVAASYFGISGPMSAFTIAFQVPNLVRSLFADAAIQAAFVPVFTEELEKGNKREAFRLASTLIYLVTLVLGAVTALFVLLAPVITPIFAPGFSGEILDLTVTLSQILFPILILLGATGMVVGVLNSYDRFAAFAISPFFWNVVIIAVLVLLEPAFHGNDRIYAYAIGVLVGTVVQLAIPAWDLRNTPFRLTRDFDWHMPEVTASPAADAAGDPQPRADQLRPAAQQHRRDARLRPRLRPRSTRRSASTCCRRESSRSRSRPSPSRPWPASPRGRSGRTCARRCRTECGRSCCC